jgi:Immunity protein 17
MHDFRDLLYLVIYVIIFGAGLGAIFAGLTGWNWYFEREPARGWAERFGKNWARVFYVFVGSMMTACTGWLILDWF